MARLGPMCGIYGAIGCGLDVERGLDALRTLRHRGPDGDGHFLDPRHDVFLGHTRLSIIDLSDAAAMPIQNEDGALTLTLNGEIYNYRELREELLARGHTFRSHGDAEVVLHLYEEVGMDCLERLHGMFAFALHDARTGEVHLARDRLGIKPLFYFHQGRRLVFASELKAIRETPGLDLEPDVTAFYDYLTYQFVPAPKTIYRHGRKLPPGHRLRFRDGEVRVDRWWDVDFTPDEGMDEARAVSELTELLDDVVREHLVADVPVGVFLSGGIDSSLVAAVATTLSGEGRRLRSFTIGSRGAKEDESDVAAHTAEVLGLDAHLHQFGVRDAIERVDLAAQLFDEPFADHSFLPTLLVSEMAAARLKVVLSGDGGDETHLGYGRYFKEERRRLTNALGDAIPLGARLVRTRPLRRFRSLRTIGEGALGRLCHYYGGIPRETKRLLLDVGTRELEGYDDYWLYREHLRPQFSSYGRQQYLDLKTALPDAILTKVDRASMHHGLEVRPPLLDHRMVEWAARLPDRLKAEDGQGKRLLRRLLARHGLSERDGIRKRGFSIPLRGLIEREGLFRVSADIDVLGAFRVEKSAIDELFQPRRDHQRLWLLYVLDSFLRTERSQGASFGAVAASGARAT